MLSSLFSSLLVLLKTLFKSTKITKRGTTATKNQGKIAAMKPSAIRHFEAFLIKVSLTHGRRPSSSSMSLEKRLIMRPDGVVSKNFMGDFRIELSTSLCRFVELLMKMRTKIDEAII